MDAKVCRLIGGRHGCLVCTLSRFLPPLPANEHSLLARSLVPIDTIDTMMRPDRIATARPKMPGDHLD